MNTQQEHDQDFVEQGKASLSRSRRDLNWAIGEQGRLDFRTTLP
jgi:hypothetical protein